MKFMMFFGIFLQKKSIFVGGRNLISLPFQLQIKLVDFQLRKFEYEWRILIYLY